MLIQSQTSASTSLWWSELVPGAFARKEETVEIHMGSNGTVADSSWLKGWKLLPSTEMTITDGDFQLFVSRKWKPRMCAVYHKAWQRKVLCWICRVVQLLERFPPNFPPLMSECFAKMANNHLAEKKRGTFSARARSEIEKVYLKKNLRTQIRFFRSLFMGEI